MKTIQLTIAIAFALLVACTSALSATPTFLPTATFAPTLTFASTRLPAATSTATLTATAPATNTPRPTNTSTATLTSVPTRVFTPTATINAQLESNARTILPIFFGYNNGAEAIQIGRWNDPDFQKAIADLKPGTLRYPAGTVANYWDWESGWVVPNDSGEPFGMGKMKPTPNRLEDFQKALNASGAIPIFDLNLLTSNLDSQLTMLRHAKQIGLPVKYIELGNEFYLRQDDYIAKFPTGADYGHEASRWIVAIRAEFSDAKIAVVGAMPFVQQNPADQRQTKWNADIFSTVKSADALTIHEYRWAGTDKTDIFRSTDVPKMLGMPFRAWGQIQQNDLPTVPAGMEVWITEYNLNDENAPVHGTWSHGLFSLAESMLFLDDNKITLIDNHALVGSAVFAAIFGNENAFKMGGGYKPPINPPKATTLARSASGWTLALFADATRGMTSSQKIAFTPNPTLQGYQDTRYPSLIGRLFTDGTRRSAIVVNLSPEAYMLKTDTVNLIAFEQIYADPITYIPNAQPLTQVIGNVTSNTMILPPYSVTKLSDRK